jgi:hypothetical protein
MALMKAWTACRWLLAAVVVLPTTGCSWTMHEETRTASAPAAAARGLAVDTRNGSITIEPADRTDIDIRATLRARSVERLALMKVTAEQDSAGVLHVMVAPADGEWWSGEGCSIKIVAPKAALGSGITARTNNGSITLAGAGGTAELTTSNGSIEVRDHAGPVKAGSSNGNLKLDRVSGSVHARTSNGRIAARLAPDAAGPVDLDTSNGSVILDVGSAFTGTLSISTSNGSITVPRDTPGVKVVSMGRRTAKVQFGTGGENASRIDTSNASVTVQVLSGR